MNYENPANGNKIPPLGPKKTPDTHGSEEHPPTMMENIFIAMGMTVAIHPWKFIIASVLISLGFASGFFTVLVTENRPEKQWVPDGAPALEQKDYVDKTWPSEQRFNFWIAQCKKDKNAAPGEGCSLLEPKYIQRMQELNQKLMDIVIDGAEVLSFFSSCFCFLCGCCAVPLDLVVPSSTHFFFFSSSLRLLSLSPLSVSLSLSLSTRSKNPTKSTSPSIKQPGPSGVGTESFHFLKIVP